MKLLFTIALLVSSVAQAASPAYQDGDIIFHESQSDQAKAIREATGSRWSHVGILFRENGQWVVAEAVQPVRITKLSAFIKRGKNREYEVHRFPNLNEAQKRTLRDEVGKYMGQNYDIYFEWSDELIYCSELVYKAFLNVTDTEIGQVQKFRDLKLDGPYAKELIRRRLEDKGKTINPEELIVTPASQIEDSDLILVEKSGR